MPATKKGIGVVKAELFRKRTENGIHELMFATRYCAPFFPRGLMKAPSKTLLRLAKSAREGAAKSLLVPRFGIHLLATPRSPNLGARTTKKEKRKKIRISLGVTKTVRMQEQSSPNSRAKAGTRQHRLRRVLARGLKTKKYLGEQREGT